jgi:hypothetical protein
MVEMGKEIGGLNELRPLFEALFGTSVTNHIFVEIEKSPESFFAAPETYKARIEDMTKEYLDKTGIENIAAEIIGAFPALVKLGIEAELKNRERDNQRIIECPAAAQFVDAILSSQDETYREVVLTEIEAIERIDIVDLSFGGAPFARLLQVAQDNPDLIAFEERIRATTYAIVHSSERVYRPMLASALRLTKIMKGCNSDIPTELGATMSQAKSFWQKHNPKLVGLIKDEIRIIRNSEAHGNTKIDPRNEVVIFTNYPHKRSPEKLILNSQEFSNVITDYLNLCLSIMAAYRVMRRKMRSPNSR